MEPATQTLGQTAYESLRGMIVEGKLTSGTRLQEKVYANLLGISRTPVREAVARLVSEGLATRATGGVPTVNSVSVSDIMEILHVRRLLECETARQAASSDEPCTLLRELRRRVEDSLEGERMEAGAHAALDEELHAAIARRAGSRLLTELIQGLKVKTRIFDKGSIPSRYEPGAKEHLAILEAVIAGKPDAAEEAMRMHIDNTREAILLHLQRFR